MLEPATFINPPCPHLPDIPTPLPITHTRMHRESCGSEYFQACLELAQSLWRSGSPAQAILQLDKSFMASHSENLPLALTLAKSYHAIIWIIEHSPDDQFLGNPVRHFQHLATRMNMKQPNAELRIWRAWACLHLSEKHSPDLFPRDEDQINKENLTIPSIEQTLAQINDIAGKEEQKMLENILH